MYAIPNSIQGGLWEMDFHKESELTTFDYLKD